MNSWQLTEYSHNNLMPRLHSTCHRHRSTETVLLRVISDLLSAADGLRATLLDLIDLSAASDTSDLDILLC